MRGDKITNILVSILICLVVVLIFLQLYQTSSVQDKINQAIRSLSITKPKDGYTPVKGIDYFDGVSPQGIKGADGRDGIDGKDSVSTHVIEKQTIIKEVPINGENGKDAFFDIRCNVIQNRWEVKLSPDDGWKVPQSIPVKCSVE